MKRVIKSLIVIVLALVLAEFIRQYAIDQARRAEAARLCYGWTAQTEPTRAWCVNKYLEFYK